MKLSHLNSLVQAGIITVDQKNQAEAYFKEHKSSGGFQKSITTVGAILIALGILSLVALNRDGMTDMIKIIVLLGSTIFSYIAGIYFKQGGKGLLGGTLLFLAGLILGASIFLIAQIYHLTRGNDVLLLIWTLMILPLVYVAKQTEYYYLYLILLSGLIIQFVMSHYFPEPDARNVMMMYILFGFLLVLVGHLHDKYYSEELLAQLYKVFGAHIVILAYFAFIATTDGVYQLSPFLVRGVTLILLGYLIRSRVSGKKELISYMFALIAIIAGVTFSEIPIINYIIFIAGCIFVMYLGQQHNNKYIAKSATIYLYLFLLFLYGRYGREYQNKALFFIIGGILMIGLGIGFSKLQDYLPTLLGSINSDEK